MKQKFDGFDKLEVFFDVFSIRACHGGPVRNDHCSSPCDENTLDSACLMFGFFGGVGFFAVIIKPYFLFVHTG